MRQGCQHVALTVLELRHPAGDLLAERQRCGVLQMGAADLDDAVEGGGLLLQRRAQRAQRRQQPLLQRLHRRHMHGRREHVVAALAAVDVVVGVHEPPFPTRAAHQLAGAVGQHLVDVHVRLRARAGLPHHQRELVGMQPRDHLVGGGHDGLGLVCRLQAQRLVDHGRRPLHPRQRPDQLRRLALAGDVEVLQRALRLRAPQAMGGHFDRAEGVVFDAAAHGALS